MRLTHHLLRRRGGLLGTAGERVRWQHAYAVRRSVGTGTIIGPATTRQAALFVVAGALALEETRAAEESRVLEIVGRGAIVRRGGET